MKEKLPEATIEDWIQRTEEEICEEVLGKKSGYIVKRGCEPKPISLYGESTRRRLESVIHEQRSLLDSQQQKIEEAQTNLANAQLKIDEQNKKIETQAIMLESQQKQLDWLVQKVNGGMPIPNS